MYIRVQDIEMVITLGFAMMLISLFSWMHIIRNDDMYIYPKYAYPMNSSTYTYIDIDQGNI